MHNIINKIINDEERYYDYNIQLGFYNNKMKSFYNYISKNNFYNIKNKFKHLNYKQKNIVVYKYLNKQKIHNIDNNKINYIKDNFKKYHYIKNDNIDKNRLNYGFLLMKEINYSQINCMDFPNINEDIEILNKNIHIYTCKYKKSIVHIKFEIINTDFYNININVNFDKNILDDCINNLNNIFKDIYDDYKFNLIDS